MEDLQSVYDLCRTNFQAGIKTYELVTIPSYEHALALSIAVSESCAYFIIFAQTPADDRCPGQR